MIAKEDEKIVKAADDPDAKLEKITDKADDKKDKAEGKAAAKEAKATEDKVELDKHSEPELG